MPTKLKKKSTKSKKDYVIARQDDGAVQITFILPWKEVEKERVKAAEHIAKDTTVPGFRKGKAPISKAIEQIAEEKLVEHTLSHMLPERFANVIKQEKLQPAVYPKYSLNKANLNEDWEIQATTCEVPKVKLGNYKSKIKSVKIPKKATKEEKENKIINKLIESYEIKIPKLLTEQEANSRLSSLLERLEKIGLGLESYLDQVKKTGEELRNDYTEQAEKAIKLDLLLQYIAVEEKITIKDKEVQDYIKAAQMSEDQKETVMLFLRKRRALESLDKLV